MGNTKTNKKENNLEKSTEHKLNENKIELGLNNTNTDSQKSSNKVDSQNIQNDDIKTDKNLKESKIKIIKIVSFIFLAIIILSLILCMALWWFNRNDLVFTPFREVNSVSRYLEIKNSSYYYFYEERNETQNVQNYSIITNFISGINKKNIKFNLNKIDYLYESFLLIINITEFNDTDSVYLGGFDIYDESIDDLINDNENLFKNLSLDNINQTKVNNTQIDLPFSKFSFYENGTIDKIYFPQDINEFYKSALIDLIEKVTPKISKSLYEDESNIRRLNQQKNGKFLNYEQIIINGELKKIKIYEDNIENDKFGRREINSNLKRTYKPSGDLVLVEMEGEAIFRNNPFESNKDMNLGLNEKGEENKSKTNESYYNLDNDAFNVNVASNMILIDCEIKPLILQRLNKLWQQINIETYKDTNNIETYIKIANQSLMEIDGVGSKNYSDYLNNNASFETYIINDTNITGNLTNNDTINNINYLNSYKSKCKILNVSFLDVYIGLQQNLYINNNNGLRQNYINLIFMTKNLIYLQ